MISKYLKAHWSRNGMDYPALNCWGLVRLARHELYGLPLLPRYDDILAEDKKGMTAAAQEVMKSLAESGPIPGAVASVWRNRLCTHVGLVIEIDNRPAVLEINEESGPRWQWLADFEAAHLKVLYHA